MEFLSNGIPFVAIDRNQDRLDRMVVLGKETGWIPPTILGDATADEVLEIAGVRQARGVMACLSDDPANLFVVITSRELNPNTRILARMTNEGSRKKMMRAGADGLVSPNQIGGLRLASEMTRPAVVTFLDEMRRDTNRNVRIEEINLTENSPLAGKTLADSQIRETTNALVLAIRRSNRDYEYNPPIDTTLQPSDTLVVLADRIEVQTVRRLCGDPTQTLAPS
jgi:voltage-gated potassium channel